MPPMLVPHVPVYSISPSSAGKSSSRSTTPAKPTYKGREYGDDPLPAKPSSDAPADARIIGRVIDRHGVFYRLKIGDVDINNVTVQEILEYVSAEHLEAYENKQFVEEAELERIAKATDELKKAERRARAAEQARLRGVAGYENDSDSSEDEVATGKHGRARPTYTHLYEKARERRRRRKRDPRTGELLSLSDEGETGAGGFAPVESSEDEVSAVPSQQHVNSLRRRRRKADLVTLELMPLSPDRPLPRHTAVESSEDEISAVLSQQHVDPLKRRRRKRDPVTGELMPLPPDRSVSQPADGHEKKRRRRKRHPRTGELMPYGWVYDPDALEEQASTNWRAGVNAISPTMDCLTISREHQTKRVRLDSQSASGSSRAHVGLQRSQASLEEEESSEDVPPPQQGSLMMKSPPKPTPGASQGQLGMHAALQTTATSSAQEPTPEPKPNTLTSILQPVAGTASGTLEDDESDGIGDREWIIEGILAHHMSDPRTHAPELGKKPVMLYQVKWESFNELTWEPMESFPDQSVVNDYMRRVARNGASHSNKQAHKQKSSHDPQGQTTGSVVPPDASTTRAHQMNASLKQGGGKQEEEEEDDAEDGEEEVVYEIESISGHHLSDPRTHPAELGNEPVMLYRVKWKGYQDFTWEPIDSFDDVGDLNRYRQKVGLPPIDDEAMKE